jgi:uncharacterized protein
MSSAKGCAEPGHAAVHMQWDVRVPLRDGVRLHAVLYIPRVHKKPGPALFTLTPYIAQTFHERGTYFAGHGYPFLVVESRGRGDSEGVFKPYIQEAKDGYDIVGWLAQQSWCNGQVAMWGGSYGGYDQWVTAKEFPAHLATIVPVAAPYMGIDYPIRNNIAAPYLMQWLTLVAGKTSQDKVFADMPFWSQRFRMWFESGAPFKQLDTMLGNPSPIFQEWLEHPHWDSYWDTYNPTAEQYAKISLPVLTITGIYDGDQPGALMHYREHMRNASPSGRARHYLVIGPWDHSGTRTPQREFVGLKVGPASLVDVPKLHLDWYAWTLLGERKPEFLKKNVAYYVMGAERWAYADTLGEVTARSQPWYLHSESNPTDIFSSGLLVPKPMTGGPPATYAYDPNDVSHAAIEWMVDPESRVDQRMVLVANGKQLIYHSPSFEEDLEISGFFRLIAWLSIDQPDTDFRATVYEIDIDGSSILLAVDSLRARYRKGLREEALIHTAEPLEYEFERFTFVSRLVRKGRRLRLVLGPINSIYSQRNNNAGGIVAEESRQDARPVTVKLFHGAEHPSALYIPYGQAAL